MAQATGLAAVTAEALTDRGILPDDPEQLDLSADLGLRAIPEDRRSRGRPKGAINRATERTAQYLLSRYSCPVETLLKMAMMPVEDLAASLGCTRAEAWAEKRLCAIAAAPYVRRRQPLEVDVTNHKVVHLTINDGGQMGISGGGIGAVALLDGVVEVVENQGVSGGDDASV